MKYYGVHACLALWEKRPDDIVRVYVEQANLSVFSSLLKWCAKNKKAYHIIPKEELEKVSESVHHEGVCILAKEKKRVSFEEMLETLGKKAECLLYLDGVQNPHNVGSILRSCAHFGITYVLGEEGKLPSLSPSACRIAKGGAEVVHLVSLAKPASAIALLQKKGFSLIATSSHGGESLYEFSYPKHSILAMGEESQGVSKALFAMAKQKVQIPGSGAVESLNVSVATSLCLGEYFRQHKCEKK